MRGLFTDLRSAFRQVIRTRSFAIVTIIVVALAAGTTAALFSVLDGLWFRSLPVERSSDIFRVFSVSNQSDTEGFSYPEYLGFASTGQQNFELAAIGGRGARLRRADGTVALVTLNATSPNFFTMLHARPAFGRLFDAGDEANTSSAVVVLGNAFWQREFGGDPSIVGRQIHLSRVKDDVLVTVVGVLPREFREIEADGDRDLWMPTNTFVALSGPSDLESRTFHWLHIVGRRARGVPLDMVHAALSTRASAIAVEHPESSAGMRIRAVSDLRYRWEEAGVHGELLLGIVALIMVLAAVNVGNLLLARAAQREHEVSIRLSLGAGRWRLARQFFVENLLLGLAGLAVGLCLGEALVRLLPHLFVQAPGFSAGPQFALDVRVLVATMMVTLLCALAFGTLPALRAAWSTNARIAPASNASLQPGRSLRVQRWMVVAQVSVSIVMLIGTGLLVRSFANTRSADIGITRRPLLNVWMTAPIESKPALLDALRTSLSTLPGVHRVAYATRAPLSLSSGGMAVNVDFPEHPTPAGTPKLEVRYNAVSSNYLDVLGTPLVSGRLFDESDQHSAEPAAIVSQTMAARYWPGESPVGKTILLGRSGAAARVMGVVKDAPISQLNDRATPYMYLPFGKYGEEELTWIMEFDGDPTPLTQLVRSRVAELDSSIFVMGVTTQGELVRYAGSDFQMTAALVSMLGALAMCLTAAGLYGTVSYGVTRRTKEIGIRIALGADRTRTAKLVLGEVGRITAIGLAIGIPAALITAKLISAALFGVSPYHVPTFVLMSALLVLVLFVAGFGPMRRAASIDPLKAIREE